MRIFPCARCSRATAVAGATTSAVTASSRSRRLVRVTNVEMDAPRPAREVDGLRPRIESRIRPPVEEYACDAPAGGEADAYGGGRRGRELDRRVHDSLRRRERVRERSEARRSGAHLDPPARREPRARRRVRELQPAWRLVEEQ